jgi:hypothetical protein
MFFEHLAPGRDQVLDIEPLPTGDARWRHPIARAVQQAPVDPGHKLCPAQLHVRISFVKSGGRLPAALRALAARLQPSQEAVNLRGGIEESTPSQR